MQLVHHDTLVARIMQPLYASCMGDLRARQRELGRQTIVDACADLVTERHHLDFTMQDIADRAGVSLRTVYNHFPAREDLLGALGAEFNAKMAARGGPEASDLASRADILAAVRTNIALFEEMGGVSEAFAQMPLADVGRDSARAVRTERIVDFLAGLMPSAPEADAHAVAVLLRHMLSHRSWFWLTREYGLGAEEVSGVITWAMDTLIDAAEAGNLPSLRDDSRALGQPSPASPRNHTTGTTGGNNDDGNSHTR